MKNRRTIITVFLLCACLVIGMGYANITRTLKFDGKATAAKNEADFDVRFTNVTTEFTCHAEPLTTAYNVVISESDATRRTIDVNLGESLKVVGDYAEITATVQNFSHSYTADLQMPSVVMTANGEYFEVTVVNKDTFAATDLAVAHSEGGADTTTITIKVELVKLPTDTDSIASACTVSFNEVSVALETTGE